MANRTYKRVSRESLCRTPALESGRRTRNDWRCFSTQMLGLKANGLPPCLPSLGERPTRSCKILLPLPAPRTRHTRSWWMLFRPISHSNPSLLRRGTAFIREISCQESRLRHTSQSFVDLPVIATSARTWRTAFVTGWCVGWATLTL